MQVKRVSSQWRVSVKIAYQNISLMNSTICRPSTVWIINSLKLTTPRRSTSPKMKETNCSKKNFSTMCINYERICSTSSISTSSHSGDWWLKFLLSWLSLMTSCRRWGSIMMCTNYLSMMAHLWGESKSPRWREKWRGQWTQFSTSFSEYSSVWVYTESQTVKHSANNSIRRWSMITGSLTWPNSLISLQYLDIVISRWWSG
jgi:hypothetical protein